MCSKYLYDEETGQAFGTHRTYIVGFIMSTLTTILAFCLVGFNLLSPILLYVFVAILAIIQLYIQLIFFLHLNTSSRSYWNIVSFIFSLIVISIIVIGTLWIMFNLYSMMAVM